MEMQLDIYTQREDLDEHLQVLTAIMTFDSGRKENIRLFNILEERFSTHSFTTVRINNSRFAGRSVTVNERFAFSISNNDRKLESKNTYQLTYSILNNISNMVQ